MSKEAMKLALEALEFIPESGSMLGAQAETKRLQGITALREALAEQPAYRAVKTFHEGKPVYVAEQPAQQEPEWYHFVKHGEDCFVPYKGQAPENATPLYTSPQQPTVPDALTIADKDSADYHEGWNDCRQLMLEMARKP